MRILIINGPNLNLLGKREPNMYGTQSFEDYLLELKSAFVQVELDYFQSNHEGQLLDKLQEDNYDGVVMNPGGLAHTSVVLLDAIFAIKTPVIEVHISDVLKREPFRHVLLSAQACVKMISGEGLYGYQLAIEAHLNS
ncbi:MAG: 3-dehydroquinate dehydratase-2 [Salibacteraceae bacterium]|jgi:3-dehydroquinate dehydratase-2